MTYLIPDRASKERRGIRLGDHYQAPHYHRQKVYQVAVVPCVELYETGTNLLLDPGFENQAGQFGETYLPRWDNTDKAWEWSGVGKAFYPTVVPWSCSDGLDWTFSTTDPRSGTYCLLGDGLPSGVPQPLIANRLFKCPDGPVYSARVVPGSVVDWELYVKPSAVGASPGSVTMRLRFLKSTGAIAGTFDVTTNNTSVAYTLRANTAVAPADSYWLEASAIINDATGDVDTWKADTARLGIA